jgi:hypothetical protein
MAKMTRYDAIPNSAYSPDAVAAPPGPIIPVRPACMASIDIPEISPNASKKIPRISCRRPERPRPCDSEFPLAAMVYLVFPPPLRLDVIRIRAILLADIMKYPT